MTAEAEPAPASRWDLLSNPGYGPYVGAGLCSGMAIQIQTVAVGWQVYDTTRNPLDLGLVALSQFAPALALVLVTGSVADRYSRRLIMGICLLAMAAIAAGLLAYALSGGTRVAPILMLVTAFGAARAFFLPARQSLLTNLVPRAQFARAIAMNSSINQAAMVGGPLAGGLLYGLSPLAAYGTTLALLLAAAACVAAIPRPPQARAAARTSWAEVTAGLSFIRGNRILLGVVVLDLAVVLLGGAVALLPVYARDVLDVGAAGLGLLRAAPAVGAISVAWWMMRHPVGQGVGRKLFAAIAVFCLATLVFALSEWVWLSVLALLVVGGSDMVSVVIRQSLVQLNTPDELRGRVNAVTQVFIGASNELGGFRAGTMAALVGPVAAVAGGAVAALGFLAVWARLRPELPAIPDLGAGARKN